MDKESIDNISIKNKLIVLLIIPILFIAALSILIIKKTLDDYKNLEFTKQQIKKAEAVSKVIHFMQLERGISIAASIAKLSDEQNKKLNQTKLELQKALDEAKELYQNDKDNKRMLEICAYISSSRKNINIEEFFIKSDIKDYYTKNISMLLDFAKTLPPTMNDRENRNYIQAYTYLSANKEALGIIRATINEAILQNRLSNNNYMMIAENYKIYNASKNRFLNTIYDAKEFLQYYENSYKNSNIDSVLAIVHEVIELNRLNNTLIATEWFDSASDSIDKLRDIEIELFKHVHNSIDEKQFSLYRNITLIGLFLLFTIITFFIAINFIARKILTLTDKLIDKKDEFEKIAKTDLLTGSGNRYRLNLDIEELDNLAIAIFNIDNFRQINDFYGHKFGDEIIKATAIKIYNFIKEDEKLRFYRLQGDEFIILASNYDREIFIKKVNELLKIIQEKFYVDNEEILLSCSCGISFEDKEHLLSSANMALKVAKESNIDEVIYDKSISLNHKYESNIKWTKKLSDALNDSRVVAFYQPIINNTNLKIEKYESLARIVDKDESIISPFLFLDVAKQTRQYCHITRNMIKQSFERFKDNDLVCSINISIKDIEDEQIVEFILENLEKYKIGQRVIFEIVESESIENFEGVMNFIEQVKKYDAKVAIDDFGTGYSNFEYLIRLKADYLKIDGSLIKNVAKDKNTYLVVSTIVEFAKKLGLKTVAEYVENEEIFNIVKELGIDYSQGYYFMPPVQHFEQS